MWIKYKNQLLDITQCFARTDGKFLKIRRQVDESEIALGFESEEECEKVFTNICDNLNSRSLGVIYLDNNLGKNTVQHRSQYNPNTKNEDI